MYRTTNSILPRDLQHLTRKQCVQFALYCCHLISNGWIDNKKAIIAITTIEKWLKGEATAEECQLVVQRLNYNYDAQAAIINAGMIPGALDIEGLRINQCKETAYVSFYASRNRDVAILQLQKEWLSTHTIKHITLLILEEHK